MMQFNDLEQRSVIQETLCQSKPNIYYFGNTKLNKNITIYYPEIKDKRAENNE